MIGRYMAYDVHKLVLIFCFKQFVYEELQKKRKLIQFNLSFTIIHRIIQTSFETVTFS